MKEIFKMYASYNLMTNKTIIKILSSLSKDILLEDRNFYYNSILELIKHITLGSWHYINAINNISDKKYSISIPGINEIKMSFENSDSNWLKYLPELDTVLLDLANNIEAEDFNTKKVLKIYNGRTVEMTVWNYFLQHITHQIHHQGQMSKIFDELKIEHEFGNIFPLIPDVKV